MVACTFLKGTPWAAGMCWVAWLAYWKGSLWAQFRQHLTCSYLVPRGQSCPFEAILFALPLLARCAYLLYQAGCAAPASQLSLGGCCGLTCCRSEGGDGRAVSHHPADHRGALHGPAIITYRSPGLVVKDFHATPPATTRDSYIVAEAT